MRLTQPRPSVGGWRLQLDHLCRQYLAATTVPNEVMGQIPENIAAAPHRLDVMTATGRLREFLAQFADEHVDNLELGLDHATIEVIEEHFLRYGCPLT